jgi:hypothetical protein
VQTQNKHLQSCEHPMLLTEATAVLELALWKHKLNEGKKVSLALEDARAKKVKIVMCRARVTRKEERVTCGAIIIKNVLPFLRLQLE